MSDSEVSGNKHAVQVQCFDAPLYPIVVYVRIPSYIIVAFLLTVSVMLCAGPCTGYHTRQQLCDVTCDTSPPQRLASISIIEFTFTQPMDMTFIHHLERDGDILA